ncbi:hypothetical protein BMETH_1057_1 [methanotrophic bacterial endosymbiont of Bathymodiolus sp.]|nr:hypothetical protein BMETH_1057_1 [methanotrophic bacterial endosymbiont of Bathymodiolus sp.]
MTVRQTERNTCLPLTKCMASASVRSGSWMRRTVKLIAHRSDTWKRWIVSTPQR